MTESSQNHNRIITKSGQNPLIMFPSCPVPLLGLPGESPWRVHETSNSFVTFHNEFKHGRICTRVLRKCRNLDVYHRKIMIKSSQNRHKIITESSQNHHKIIAKSSQNRPKTIIKSSQNHHKIIIESS